MIQHEVQGENVHYLHKIWNREIQEPRESFYCSLECTLRMSGGTENNRYIVQVFVGALSQHYEALSVEASKQTTSEEIVSCIVERLSLADSPGGSYELAEVIGDSVGQECKERRLGPTESPVALMLLWPKILHSQQEYYR